MTDLEKINAIIKENFGVELNNTEKQGLLSSEYVLTIMFDKEGEIQFTIVQGADPESDWESALTNCAKCLH